RSAERRGSADPKRARTFATPSVPAYSRGTGRATKRPETPEGSMHLRRVKVATVVSVFALVGVACASDSSSSSAGGTSTAAGSYTGAPFTTLTQGTLLVASCLDYAPFEN